MNLPDRFWAKVDRDGPLATHSQTGADIGACWVWTGSTTFGYGGVHLDGVTRRAHRVVYEALVGPIPEGMQLDHLCRNRACVNPEHLEPVTNRENTKRGRSPGQIAAFHRAKTHCPAGHPYAGDNLVIRANGGRACRTCMNDQGRAAMRARRARA